MMSKPDSEMDGTICKECNRLISEHLPEELEECMRKTEFKKLKDDDLRLKEELQGLETPPRSNPAASGASWADPFGDLR